MSIPDPIVLLDARAKYVHPAFQMTRASTKTVFDSAGRMVTVPPNAIGWDHDPATGRAQGYLAEPSATNLLLHSNDLTQGAWVASELSVTPSAITGPNGDGIGKLVESSESSFHHIRQAASVGGSPLVASAILRAGERSEIGIEIANNSDTSNNARVNFDLSAGAIVSTTDSGDATLIGSGIRPLGGQFYFVWVAVEFASSVSSAFTRLWMRHNGSNNYVGDGVSGLYAGCIQLEEGSYPTSYIETGAATATRAGDSLLLSDLSDFPWFAAGKGTFAWEYELGNLVPLGGMISILGSTFTVRQSASGQGTVLTGNAVTSANFIPSEDTEIGKYMRAAFSYDRDNYSTSYNGRLHRQGAVTDTIPANGTLRLGHENHIRISRAVYYPARLSNADLQSLTAIQE